MASKLKSFYNKFQAKYGPVQFPEFMPPPQSADADAALEVASKNAAIVAGAVLGLHGPANEGYAAASKLLEFCVDWNEARVCSTTVLAEQLGKDPRAKERIALLHRFLEAFFLKQRNVDLDCLVGLKPNERRTFLSDLEIFTRDELSAILLTCFAQPGFPPSDAIHAVALAAGLFDQKTTILQMAKAIDKDLKTAEEQVGLYNTLYAIYWECGGINENPEKLTDQVKNLLKGGKEKAVKKK